jgi:predicted ribosome quality control (RQC) complex YloA/Tae2 family protein
MNIDALTTTALVDELRRTVLGGRIQHVVLTTPVSVGLEIYHAGRRHHLLISANPRGPRIHLVDAKLSRGVDHDTSLLLLLRKYVRNGIVTAIEQPPLERIVVLSITKYPSGRKEHEDDDVTEERRCEVVVELLGQRANLVLVDDDNIISRTVYTLPPRSTERRDPRTASATEIQDAWGRGDDPAKALAAMYAGVSPLLAREAIARAQADAAEAGSSTTVAAHLRRLYTEPFQPSLAYERDQPVAFAPYLLTQYADARPAPSMSAALQSFYDATEQLTAHAQRRDQLLAQVRDARTRLERQREALARELARAEALDTLRWEGEMIYGYLHTLVPGQTALEVEGRSIKLNPNKTAVENAQTRFREYDKAKGALAGVPERLAATETQLRYIDDMVTLLELADSFEAISTIERELVEQGVTGKRGERPKGPRSAPLRLTSSDGTMILVGRSAGQNEDVTFNLAQPDDLWFHARDVPGAHVVALLDGEIGDATMLEAAGLAAHFSKARNSTSVEVTVCERRNVRKVAGGPPGLVTVRNERSIRVPPLAPEDIEPRL